MTGLDPSRSVDKETLRYLSQMFGRRPEVQQTSLFPATKLESLIVTLDTDYYPEHVDAVSTKRNGRCQVSVLRQRKTLRTPRQTPSMVRDTTHATNKILNLAIPRSQRPLCSGCVDSDCSLRWCSLSVYRTGRMIADFVLLSGDISALSGVILITGHEAFQTEKCR